MSVVYQLQTAVAYHNAGNYSAAEAIYQKILQIQPTHADALHLLGLLKYQTGDAKTATKLIEQAIHSNPKVANFHNNCGEAHRSLGHMKTAERCYRQAIKLNPQHFMAYNNLALVLMDANKLDEAEKQLKTAQRLSSEYIEAIYNLGRVFYLQGRLDFANEQLQKTLKLDPDFDPALRLLGTVYDTMGNYEQAISLFDRAIAQDPTDIASMNSKGKTLIKAGQIEAAVLCFQNIISLNWKLPEVYCNLGVALHQLDRVHDARDAFQTALKLKKGYFEPLRNMAILLRDQGDIDGSINAFEQLISGYPEQVDLHFDLACSLLLKGDYARGWQEYEWRWISTNTTKPKLKGKEWRGEPLSNKTILIYCEQSAGDAIQFSRFIPMLAAQGLKTILQCPDTLIPLFSHMKGVDQVISVNQKAKGYDVHCPIMSLPLYLGITLDNLPARTPYLSHDYRPVNELQLSKEKYHIGVAWAGSTMHSIDSKHSCNVELFRSLTDIDRVQLHSLQKLDKDATTPDFMVDYSELLTNYGNTAALINKLDLVITVDTSVAHLAGALGKPVWLLLAHAPNWSWLQKGESSPWYPTAKLIRQISPGDWRGIFAEIRNTLSMQLGGNKLVSEQQTESSYELNSAIYSDGFNQIAKCRHGMMIFNKHDAYVGRSLKLYGEFSEGEIEVFDRYISPGHTVVEVGANIGAHTVYLKPLLN